MNLGVWFVYQLLVTLKYLILSLQQSSKSVFSNSSLLLSKGERLLAVPVVAGGGDSEAGLWVDQWLLGLGLSQSEWLLSIPVVTSGGNGETSLWVNKWLLSLGLSEGKWLLTVPVVSGSSDGETSLWVNKRLSRSSSNESNDSS